MATVTAELTENYRVDLTNGVHRWRADEPHDLGGDNTGPNPYDLLLGSLAACTVITLSMYAQRKDIPVTSISASYRHEKVHVDDCEQCTDEDGSTTRTGMVDRITSEIFIDGDFDEATRRRLHDVAARCPVHKTLEHGVVFDETVYAG